VEEGGCSSRKEEKDQGEGGGEVSEVRGGIKGRYGGRGVGVRGEGREKGVGRRKGE